MIDIENLRAESIEPATAERRLEVLERIVLDLMMEIEALRAAIIATTASAMPQAGNENVLDDSPAGVDGTHTPYGQAYLETGWMTHWSAGPSSGMDKLLELFYGHDRDHAHSGRWREILMLMRFGYNEEQIQKFISSAAGAETCT